MISFHLIASRNNGVIHNTLFFFDSFFNLWSIANFVNQCIPYSRSDIELLPLYASAIRSLNSYTQ